MATQITAAAGPARSETDETEGITAKIFTPKPARPAPSGTTGVTGWLRANMFASVRSAALTVLGLWIVYTVVGAVASWAWVNAVWEAGSRRECLDGSAPRGPAGPALRNGYPT